MRWQKSPKDSPFWRASLKSCSTEASVGHDFLGRHEVFVDEVEPIAEHAAAEEDRVLVFRFADEADVGVVGPGAAVRAAGHARGEDFVFQAELLRVRLPVGR